MDIIRIIKLEECIDGLNSFEVLCSDSITKDFIYFLGDEGALDYYSFKKPFYKIDIPDKYIINGVEGNNTFKVMIYKKDSAELLNYLENTIKKYTCSAKQRPIKIKDNI